MFLTIASYALAAELREDHPSTYVVRKGDTLWDIAGRFLKKPWQWPEIWQANPQIKNPHLIYPGDIISLAYLDGRPYLSTGPQMREGEPVDAVPLAEIEAFLKQLDVINDDVRNLPHVVGLEEDRLMSSAGQAAYVRGLSAEPGTLVRIVRPTAQYFRIDPKPYSLRDGYNELDDRARPARHDWETHWTEHSAATGKGEIFLGNEVRTVALGEVTQVRGEVTIVVLREERREVRMGDRILPIENQPYDATYFPHAPASIPANARVLAVADNHRYAGTRSVIALNLGRADGVDNGTVFSVWAPGAHVPDRIANGNLMAAKNDVVVMPDEFTGRVMVFRTFEKVSYGLLMEGIKPIQVNYRLKHPDATE